MLPVRGDVGVDGVGEDGVRRTVAVAQVEEQSGAATSGSGEYVQSGAGGDFRDTARRRHAEQAWKRRSPPVRAAGG